MSEAMELDNVELLRLEVTARCGCGETLERGEQAGFDTARRELLCLWCLADLSAGRPRPKRRASRPDVPAVAPSTSSAAYPGAAAYPDAAGPNSTASPVPTSSTDPAAYLAPLPSPARPRRGTGAPGTAASLVVALVLVLGCLALFGKPILFPSGQEASAAAGDGGISHVGDLIGSVPLTPEAHGSTGSLWPPVPHDAQATPLRRPPAQRSTSTSYSFLFMSSSGRPVAFDPCRPIHLRVNLAQAPSGANRLLRDAAGAVTAATGLVFTIEGSTTEAPNTSRPPRDPARYGDAWSPVLVSWTDPDAVPGLAGRVVGLAGPVVAPYRDPSEMHLVSGTIHLDGPAFRGILREPGGRERARAIVMHELAHLVGLGHVNDRTQLMFEDNVGQTAFGEGDLEGLRRLGSGPCFSG